jgi:hypothetical protein
MIYFVLVDFGLYLVYILLNFKSSATGLVIRDSWEGGEFIGMDENRKQPVKSSILKCGKRTYFFDVREASNNSKYLTITESSFGKDPNDRKRNTFLMFSDDLKNFQNRLSEISGDLAA